MMLNSIMKHLIAWGKKLTRQICNETPLHDQHSARKDILNKEQKHKKKYSVIKGSPNWSTILKFVSVILSRLPLYLLPINIANFCRGAIVSYCLCANSKAVKIGNHIKIAKRKSNNTTLRSKEWVNIRQKTSSESLSK